MPQFRVYYLLAGESCTQEITAKTPSQARVIVAKEYTPEPIVVTKIKNLTKRKK